MVVSVQSFAYNSVTDEGESSSVTTDNAQSQYFFDQGLRLTSC
jgi:hypothetical protein